MKKDLDAALGRPLTRQEFLKLGGAGLAGAALLGTAGCGARGGGGGGGMLDSPIAKAALAGVGAMAMRKMMGGR